MSAKRAVARVQASRDAKAKLIEKTKRSSTSTAKSALHQADRFNVPLSKEARKALAEAALAMAGKATGGKKSASADKKPTARGAQVAPAARTKTRPATPDDKTAPAPKGAAARKVQDASRTVAAVQGRGARGKKAEAPQAVGRGGTATKLAERGGAKPEVAPKGRPAGKKIAPAKPVAKMTDAPRGKKGVEAKVSAPVNEAAAGGGKLASGSRKSAATTKAEALRARTKPSAVPAAPPSAAPDRAASQDKKAAPLRKKAGEAPARAPKAQGGKAAVRSAKAEGDAASARRQQIELPLATPEKNKPSGKTESAERRSKEESVSMREGAPSAAPVQKKRAVVRIAAGERRPKLGQPSKVEESPAPVAVAPEAPRPIKTIRRAGGGRVELNPRLESSRPLLGRPEPQGVKPMSVAEKKRAAAELAFAKVAPSVERTVSAPVVSTNGVHAGGATPPAPHKSTFEARISERDSLSTTLRLAETRDSALSAARELATRFQLPPDQALLCKVISLGEADLTKLALEELLELDDRGRVRRTPELKESLDRLESNDRETLELKDLLLEKIGAFSG